MKGSNLKLADDIAAIALTLAAIVTGFILHNEVWHSHIYDNTALWALHEASGLVLLVAVILHCTQHSFWFRNYAKIKPERKRVTTILLAIGVIVAATGVVLMCGSHSETVSHVHYVGAILFVALAIGHVAKRWKLFKNLVKQR